MTGVISRTPVQTFQIEYHCSDCGEEAEFTGIILTAKEPKEYLHRCPGCDCRFALDQKYPRLDIQPLGA